MNSINPLVSTKQLLSNFFLFAVLFFFAISTNAQCVTDIDIEVINSTEVVSPMGMDSCQYNLDIVVTNNGGCDVTGFDVIVEYLTPEGVDQDTVSIAGPFGGGNSVTVNFVDVSNILYDDMNMDCFDISNVAATAFISGLSNPTSITQTVDCINSLGSMTVCVNDNSIVCDDSNCIPIAQDCVPVILLEVDEGSIVIADAGASGCQIDFELDVINNSACNMQTFDVDLSITTPEGTFTATEIITGPIVSLTTSVAAIDAISPLLQDDTTGDCFGIDDITITATISTTNPPVAETVTIQCPGQLGTMEVCSNNNSIVCDDSRCSDIPQNCNIILDFEVDQSAIVITPGAPQFCNIDFPVLISNNGGCDIQTGFHIDISIVSPEGTDVFSQTVPSGIASANQFMMNIVLFSDILLDDATGDCFDVDDITITVTASTTSPPELITRIIDCEMGIGSKVVCANNESIVCSDTGCDPIPETCDTDIRFRVEPNTVVVSPFNPDSCQVDLEVKVFNYGGCEVTGFNLIVRFSTAVGVDSSIVAVPNAFASNASTLFMSSLASDIFKDPNSSNCINVDDIVITLSIDPMTPVNSIVVPVPCTSGTGVMMVCASDNDIVCDNTTCIPIPQTCAVITEFNIDDSSFNIVEAGSDSCTITFDYCIFNNGGCILNPFDFSINIASPEGDTTVIFTIPQIESDSVYCGNYELKDTLFFDDLNGACYAFSQFTISANYETLPTIVTEVIPCAAGTGEMTVCASNNDIICDDSGCVALPETCDVIVDIELLRDSSYMQERINLSCEFGTCLLVSNNGGCDLSGFDIEFTFASPEGNETFIYNIPINLPSDTTIMICPSFTSMLFFDNALADCYRVEDIVVQWAIAGTGPSVITTDLPCPVGTGTISVCANNNNIVCDDTNCVVDGSCETFVRVTVDNSSVAVTDASATECKLDFDYLVTNNGDCDIEGFDLNFTITTASGTTTYTELVPGPIPAGMTISVATTHTDAVLKDPITSACYPVDDINISYVFTTVPQPVTVLVACVDEPGSMLVCANNTNITCTDCSISLAIDLFGFNAQRNEDQVDLTWSTSSEVNNDYFDVEHSIDGENFVAIGTVKGKGNSDEREFYAFTHHDPSIGDNFYRLKMVDILGDEDYTFIKHVEFTNQTSINVFPNPSSDVLNIAIKEGFELNSSIEVYDVTGRKVLKYKMEAFDDLYQLNIQALEQGAYILQYKSDFKTKAVRFIKN